MRSERGLTRDPRQKSRRRTWNLKEQMEPGGRRWSLEGAGGAWRAQVEPGRYRWKMQMKTGDELEGMKKLSSGILIFTLISTTCQDFIAINESCFNHFFQGLESSTEHFETCHKSIEEGSLQFNRTGF